jgi:uncharacterized protein YcaQ
MPKTDAVYPLSAVRALALHAQGLTTPNGAEPPATLEAIYNVVAQLGAVQIDTLHVVQRSHCLVLWSRRGCYDPADFDRLIYDPAQRLLFEGWQRAACILPLAEYRYQIPLQHHLRVQPASWSARWLVEPGSRELIQSVLERVRREGAVRVSDFPYHGPKRGSWWDWKPAKHALEHLYAWGDLMIAGRVSFQRVYDLTERVLPAWVDTAEPTMEERDRHWVERGVYTFGVCDVAQAGDDAWMKRARSRPHVTALLSEGVLVPIQTEDGDGKVRDLVVHRDNLPLLEQAAAGEIVARRTTFLSPFDSFFWPQRRDTQLWGYHSALEAYKPAPQRRYGYFCLNILHRDRLVGRLDPKVERANGTMRLKALYLEPGVEPEEELVQGVATAMRDFLSFHKAHDLVVEHSEPEEFGARLLAAL